MLFPRVLFRPDLFPPESFPLPPPERPRPPRRRRRFCPPPSWLPPSDCERFESRDPLEESGVDTGAGRRSPIFGFGCACWVLGSGAAALVPLVVAAALVGCGEDCERSGAGWLLPWRSCAGSSSDISFPSYDARRSGCAAHGTTATRAGRVCEISWCIRRDTVLAMNSDLGTSRSHGGLSHLHSGQTRPRVTCTVSATTKRSTDARAERWAGTYRSRCAWTFSTRPSARRLVNIDEPP